MMRKVVLFEEGDFMVYNRETQCLWFENKEKERIPFNGDEGSILYPSDPNLSSDDLAHSLFLIGKIVLGFQSPHMTLKNPNKSSDSKVFRFVFIK